MARSAAALLIALVVAACGPSAGVAPAASRPPTPLPGGVPAPGSPGPAAPPLVVLPGSLDLSAPAPDLLWALANRRYLFFSSDRGDTWTRRSLPAERLDEISFVSAREGWAMAAAGSPEATIWATADGALSWRLVRRITDLQPLETLGGLRLVDGRRALMTSRIEGRGYLVFRTADGGATWARSSPLPARDGDGYAYGIGRPAADGPTAAVAVGPDVFRSEDGGATWAPAGRAPGGFPNVVTPLRWLTLPGGLQTRDGGATWAPWAASYNQAAPVAPAVVAAGDLVVYATVRGGLQRSDDGGQSWRMLRTPGT